MSEVPRPPRLTLTRAERCALTDLLVELVASGTRAGRGAGILAATDRPAPADDPAGGATPPVCRPPGRDEDRLWSALPVLAEGHGVAALVAPRLAPHAPDAAARALVDAAARTLARGQRMTEDAAQVAAALQAAAVPFAWIKGAWLAPRCYDPPAARPLADLDLLVPPPADARAVRVLADLGYREIRRTWKHRAYLRPGNTAVVDYRGEHPANPRPIEVHAWLGEAFRGVTLNLSRSWQPALPAAELPPVVGMAHVAAHAGVDALERRARLVQWVDLARLAAELDAADWDGLAGLIGTPHAARFAWPALALARRTVGLAIPPDVAALIEAMVDPPLRAWVAGADLDAVSPFGRGDAARRLGEVPAMWPRTAAERRAVWRFILAPGRWQLADRYPRLARSPAWPLMYARHLAYSVRRLAERWRQRR